MYRNSNDIESMLQNIHAKKWYENQLTVHFSKKSKYTASFMEWDPIWGNRHQAGHFRQICLDHKDINFMLKAYLFKSFQKVNAR